MPILKFNIAACNITISFPPGHLGKCVVCGKPEWCVWYNYGQGGNVPALDFDKYLRKTNLDQLFNNVAS